MFFEGVDANFCNQMKMLQLDVIVEWEVSVLNNASLKHKR